MACRTLSGIAKDNCVSNKGGLKTTVWATNRSNLVIGKEKDNNQEETGYATLTWATDKSAADMVSYSFRKQSSGLTSEGTFDDANGVNFFTNNLALVFARPNVQKRLAIQALALQEDLAVIVEDANGEIHFLGMDDSVTTTAAGANTGTAASDANNYTITLTDISNELPYLVKPETLATLLNTGSGNGE